MVQLAHEAAALKLYLLAGQDVQLAAAAPDENEPAAQAVQPAADSVPEPVTVP